MDGAGSWIAVFVGGDGAKYHVTADAWDELTAKHRDWVERRRDSVLELTCTDGEPCVFAASVINDFTLSTSASRERLREINKALKAEDPLADG